MKLIYIILNLETTRIQKYIIDISSYQHTQRRKHTDLGLKRSSENSRTIVGYGIRRRHVDDEAVKQVKHNMKLQRNKLFPEYVSLHTTCIKRELFMKAKQILSICKIERVHMISSEASYPPIIGRNQQYKLTQESVKK